MQHFPKRCCCHWDLHLSSTAAVWVESQLQAAASEGKHSKKDPTEEPVLSCSVKSNSLWPHGLQPARLLCPWDSPGKNTAVGCHFLLQGILPTQESNQGLLHCRQILYWLSYEGSPPYCWEDLKPRPLIGSHTSIFLRGRIEEYSLGILWYLLLNPAMDPEVASLPSFQNTPKHQGTDHSHLRCLGQSSFRSPAPMWENIRYPQIKL